MNIKEVKSKKLYKEYSLEIPFEDVDKEINKKIDNLIPTITLPGFRKGKAPASIVRKKYEDNILNEVIQNVISVKTSDLIKEKKLNLFRQPKIDLKNFEKNKPVEINLKIDLQPEVKLNDFSKLNINKYEIKLSKKNEDFMFQQFLNSQKNFKAIKNERVIKKTDKVNINLLTNNEQVPEYLRSQKNIPIDTDIDQEFLPGINKALINNKLKKGDKKKIIFDLSKISKNNDLKKVEYLIEILSIEEKTKFIITDEYLKNNGFKHEKDLKDFIIKNNTLQYNQGLKQIEKKQLMDLLDGSYQFDLPEGVLEDDFNEIWQRIQNAKKDDKLDKDDKKLNDDKLKKRYQKISVRRVKLGVLLQFIAKEEKTQISEEELNSGIMQYSSQYPGQEKQIMEYIRKNPSSVESIKASLLEQKIIDTILSKAKLTNKKIDIEQYKKLEEEAFDIKS